MLFQRYVISTKCDPLSENWPLGIPCQKWDYCTSR